MTQLKEPVNTLNGVTSPTREEKLAQLQKIIDSHSFRNAEILKSFLKYVVDKSLEGHESEVKEFTIASEVFGRKENYDPRIDSLVRVQATRLRTKLEDYYESEGKQDLIFVNLPKGHYLPVFEYRKTNTQSSEVSSEAQILPRRRSSDRTHYFQLLSWEQIRTTLFYFFAGLSVVLIFLSFHYFSQLQQLKTQLKPSQSALVLDNALLSFWEYFLDPANPVLIAYSNAVFEGNAIDGMKYWYPVEGSAENISPPSVSRVARPSGITDVYTGVGEVIAVHDLGDLFSNANKVIRVARSLLLTWEDLKTQDIIFLGGPPENILLRRLPHELDFVFQMDQSQTKCPISLVVNRKVKSGEQEKYVPMLEGLSQSSVTKDYALITRLKGIEPKRHILILAGNTTFGTQACAEYLTKAEHVRELMAHLNISTDPAHPKIPESFQVVLEVQINGSVPIRTSYVTHHVLNY
jgi:hypothetical protein